MKNKTKGEKKTKADNENQIYLFYSSKMNDEKKLT